MNMKEIFNKNIRFISEQDGDVERQFKAVIIDMLQRSKKMVRAYLARVHYGEDDNGFNVAICYKVSTEFDQKLLNETVAIFKGIFSVHEHVDILFLNHVQEETLREICCPFFTTPMFQVQQPDFYLDPEEGCVLSFPVACFKRKKLIGINHNECLLCDIKPAITGQQYGLGVKDIYQLLFMCRHVGVTLSPIFKWPVFVYVARPLIDEIENISYVGKTDINIMWLGALYRNKKDIPRN